MDTSEKYIKMCNTEEIQKYMNDNAKYGDLYTFKTKFKHHIHIHPNYRIEFKEKPIWLPRQNQLQEMSGMTWIGFDEKCYAMYIKTETPLKPKEQMGIMVIMEEKHQKIWDDRKEEWIKE